LLTAAQLAPEADVSDLLIAVPNVSEGVDHGVLAAIGDAFTAGGARVLDVHADSDHGRSVFTLAGRPGALAPALQAGIREAAARVDLRAHAGRHPHVGAVDVVPVVHLDAARRGAACAEALVTAHLLGNDPGLPCFLYGVLGGGRTRADLRRGGPAALAARVLDGELAPDFGPDRIDAGAGATLVAARPPLVAFNVELAPPAGLDDARRIAARIREGGPDGLPGLRAIGVALPARGGVAQVSMNVEDHLALPLAAVVAAVAAHAEPAEAEVVGLPPAAAFAGYPDLPTRGKRTLEEALAGHRP
jgi:glutamate formiminotransferase/glutamate formiminotransferase/formiminotetrahydrofolate cyclodeaminase